MTNKIKSKWCFWPLFAILIAALFIGVNKYYYGKKDDKLMANTESIKDELNSTLDKEEMEKISDFDSLSILIDNLLIKDDEDYKLDYESTEDYYKEKISLEKVEDINKDLRNSYKDAYTTLGKIDFDDNFTSKEVDNFKDIIDDLQTGFIYRIYGVDEKMKSFTDKDLKLDRSEMDRIKKIYQEANSKIRDGRNSINRLKEKNK